MADWYSIRSMRGNVHGGGKKADWGQVNGQPMLPAEGTSTLHAYPPLMTCRL